VDGFHLWWKNTKGRMHTCYAKMKSVRCTRVSRSVYQDRTNSWTLKEILFYF
jgi:hypothetical protein